MDHPAQPAVADFTKPVRAFIEAQRVARLATIDARDEPDGQPQPHLVPVCFALEGGRLYSVVDDKPKRTIRLRRLRNIEAHPQATLLFDVYADDWSRLAWAMVRGRAAVLTGNEQDADEHARALAALRARYRQYRAIDLDRRPVIRLTPERVSHWGLSHWGSGEIEA